MATMEEFQQAKIARRAFLKNEHNKEIGGLIPISLDADGSYVARSFNMCGGCDLLQKMNWARAGLDYMSWTEGRVRDVENNYYMLSVAQWDQLLEKLTLFGLVANSNKWAKQDAVDAVTVADENDPASIQTAIDQVNAITW